MRVKRPHSALLAVGTILTAASAGGFWEDKEEAERWACMGVALTAAACLQGARTPSQGIIGNNYDPPCGDDRVVSMLRRRRKRRKFAVVGVSIRQLLARLYRTPSSHQCLSDDTPLDSEAYMSRLSDRHFYEFFRLSKDNFRILCDHLKLPDEFRCGMAKHM
jgi:hypothetical protein